MLIIELLRIRVPIQFDDAKPGVPCREMLRLFWQSTPCLSTWTWTFASPVLWLRLNTICVWTLCVFPVGVHRSRISRPSSMARSQSQHPTYYVPADAVLKLCDAMSSFWTVSHCRTSATFILSKPTALAAKQDVGEGRT